MLFSRTKIKFLNNGNNKLKNILKFNINIYNKLITIKVRKKSSYITAAKNNK